MKWLPDDIRLAAELKNDGLTSKEIAPRFGVSASAIRSVLSMSHQERCRAKATATGYLSAFYSGPAIARCPIQDRFNKNAIEGSAMLRDAILAMAA